MSVPPPVVPLIARDTLSTIRNSVDAVRTGKVKAFFFFGDSYANDATTPIEWLDYEKWISYLSRQCCFSPEEHILRITVGEEYAYIYRREDWISNMLPLEDTEAGYIFDIVSMKSVYEGSGFKPLQLNQQDMSNLHPPVVSIPDQ